MSDRPVPVGHVIINDSSYDWQLCLSWLVISLSYYLAESRRYPWMVHISIPLAGRTVSPVAVIPMVQAAATNTPIARPMSWTYLPLLLINIENEAAGQKVMQ